MKNNTIGIDEIAIAADNLQSLLCILFERKPQKIGGAEVHSTIGLAWDLSCRISTWLDKEAKNHE
ncbi:hypothetical protein [Pragia fontium]|uniref:hypothetical protein n=1 Tax=Pragia fontium TaxID=82985 RepID=UPI00064B4022|nr:hypothetical protein [Pragia fontium]AKJ41527.1 hypothetical protein QQ39_05055 [Pragia fontium]